MLDSDRWQWLEGMGARPQRLLFASTSNKDPQASDVLYMAALAAPMAALSSLISLSLVAIILVAFCASLLLVHCCCFPASCVQRRVPENVSVPGRT